MFSEIAICLTIAGLVGRRWLVGFALGISLLLVQAVLYCIGMNRMEDLGTEFWGICCVPAPMLIATLPLLGMRKGFGWCFTFSSNTSKPRVGIEDILWATLLVACCLFAFRFPISIWTTPLPMFAGNPSLVKNQIAESEIWTSGVVACIAAMAMSLIVLLPMLFIWFRIMAVVGKCAAFLAFSMLGLASSAAVYHFAAVAAGGPTGWGEAFEFAFFAAGPAMLAFVLQLATLHWTGIKLRSLRGREKLTPKPHAAESETQDPFAEESTAVQAPIPKGIFTPSRVIALSILAITVSVGGWSQLIVAKMLAEVERQQELYDFAVFNGGDLGLWVERGMFLEMWENASDADLARFDEFGFRELDLSDSSITANGIAGRSNLKGLTKVDLSRTPEIGGSLQAVIRNCPRVSTIYIQDSEFALSELTPLFERPMNGHEFMLVIDGSKVRAESPQSQSGQLWPDRSPSELVGSTLGHLSAMRCGLTDEMIRGWVGPDTKYLYLRENQLRGDFDFLGSGESGARLREIDLSNNPLDDDLFGSKLVGAEIAWLKLKETSLTNGFFAYLKQAKSVWGLTLGKGNLTEEALAAADPPGLFFLSLTSDCFTGHCFRDWHPGIVSLELNGSASDDETVGYLSNLPELEELNVGGTKISAKALVAADLPKALVILVNGYQYTNKEKINLRNFYPNLEVY
ncbi:MAG: hypothetical protein AAF483_30445 [Planctomycetota bacterium]